MTRSVLLPSAARGDVDVAFIRARRSAGTPDAAIARMGGWHVGDVIAIPRAGVVALARVEKPPRPILKASEIPEVCEILLHVAESHGVSISDILGGSHIAEIVSARHEAIAVTWELNRFTARDLAEIFRMSPEGVTSGLKRHYERLRKERDWS